MAWAYIVLHFCCVHLYSVFHYETLPLIPILLLLGTIAHTARAFSRPVNDNFLPISLWQQCNPLRRQRCSPTVGQVVKVTCIR